MKRIFLSLLALGMWAATSNNATAQIKNDRGTFTLPSRGDVLVETQANLNFTGGGIFNLNDGFLSGLRNGFSRIGLDTLDFHRAAYYPLLKLRLVGNHNIIHRISFNISYNSQSFNQLPKTDVRGSEYGGAISYGIEKYYTPAERLLTYVGGDVSIGYARQSIIADSSSAQNAYGAGIRVFTGADYYVLPKVYLGIELGWGLGYYHYGEAEFNNRRTTANNNDFLVTPYITPVFRLGYVLTNCKHKMKGDGEPMYRTMEKDDDDN